MKFLSELEITYKQTQNNKRYVNKYSQRLKTGLQSQSWSHVKTKTKGLSVLMTVHNCSTQYSREQFW